MRYATLLILIIAACTPSTMEQHTNLLIHETSPYLLQHAHNPVDWHPWNEETLAKAKKENKPLLISIGYSACHWCHVMEHESFEDDSVAAIMNKHFINIKVDREERPDIDQIYMTAVQLMTNSGGWPLNCVAMPDGRPFWGGTYFRKEDWKRVLSQLADLYNSDYQKVEEYATQLQQGIQQTDRLVKAPETTNFTKSFLAQHIEEWSRSFDLSDGGYKHAPKFPLPNNYDFLLQYGHLSQNEAVLDYVELTLDKMAQGGIYDQLGGGFARYSVDTYWKVPHFEKMLYDNGQLLSLYARAYQKFQKPYYQEIVAQTIQFVETELTNSSGAFYSALDADSEGEEGKFYVWTKAELQNLLKENYAVFADYYRINQDGHWEHGNHILMKTENEKGVAKAHNIDLTSLKNKITELNSLLLEERNKRIKPGLDDKCLTSWNAIMLSGLLDAYAVFQDKHYLDLALKNAAFIKSHQLKDDGSLWHSYKNGKSSINGYLEDYAFTIEAFIKVYQNSFDEEWLLLAQSLAEYCFEHFFNEDTQMFYFTSDEDPALISRKTEVDDNVTPASNSVMAKNLNILSKYFENTRFENVANQMVRNMKQGFERYPSGHSNWGILMLDKVFPQYELVVTGPDSKNTFSALQNDYLPNVLLAGAEKDSKLALLSNRYVDGTTTFYLCYNKACKLPTNDLESCLKLMD